jgi:complex iron-sulfur molybdoenzyme family reductase subunit gamma
MAVIESVSTHRRYVGLLLLALMVAVALRLLDVAPAVAQSQVVTAWNSALDPGLDPNSPVWEGLPPAQIQLTAQNVAPPMSDRGIGVVMVRAIHHGDVLYVNLQWRDATLDQTTDAVGVFADAVAVQFPSVAATSVPAICMGQADGAVNIWHWRADSQAGVSAIPESGYVDLYPQTDRLHSPAAAAGNVMASPLAVQNLVAGGFGTLAPLEQQVIQGAGEHDGMRWSVTMARPFSPPGTDQPAFAIGGEADVAVAVWDGSNQDRDGQKSVSSFVRMEIAANDYVPPGPPPESPGNPWLIVFGTLGITIAFLLFISRAPKGDANLGNHQ